MFSLSMRDGVTKTYDVNMQIKYLILIHKLGLLLKLLGPNFKPNFSNLIFLDPKLFARFCTL